MAKPQRSKSSQTQPQMLLTLDSEGVPPDCRVTNATQAFAICTDLLNIDQPRAQKRIRVYKCYKRFPTSSYTNMAANCFSWQSRVNWGSLEFIVDNQKASFYDMITERPQHFQIITKYGNEKDRKETSELISEGYNDVLNDCDWYLFNAEQDIEDMCLYGKGVEMWRSREGFQSDHIFAGDLLVPDNVKVDFSNCQLFAVKDRFSPTELYDCIRDQESAKTMGWNVDGTAQAIMYYTSSPSQRMTQEEWYRTVAEGSTNLTTLFNQTIDVYTLFVKEFKSKKWSKMMILQNYTPVTTSLNNQAKGYGEAYTDGDSVSKVGFLYFKENYFEGIEEILSPFTDSVGSGLWHEIKGIAERSYVQCRQDDMTKNRLVDAITINMMLILQGETAEVTKRLKEMEFSPYMILPNSVNMVQHRLELPVRDALTVNMSMMADLYRGISQYQINAPTNQGGQRTKGEAELDAAESAKLSGVQVRRFNSWCTRWGKQTAKRFFNLKSGEKGYEHYKKFCDLMDEWKVPKEAYQWKNIRSVKSMMLNGAGSPSFKIMAAEKTIQLTGITPANEGQELAIRQGISALQGVQNVDAFRPKIKYMDQDVIRVIGFENANLSDPHANPADTMVQPEDPHLQHIGGHIGDMQWHINKIQQQVQSQDIDAKGMRDAHATLMAKGGHIFAHVDFLAKDQTKKNELKAAMQTMQDVQKATDEIGSIAMKMTEAEANADSQGKLSKEEIAIQAKKAMADLDVYTKGKLGEIKLANIAAQHELRSQITKDKAANDIAIQRAKEQQKLTQEAVAPKKPAAKKTPEA